MVKLSDDAVRHIHGLRNHYEDRGRPEAALNLESAVARAVARIESRPASGLLAPRPYPTLAGDGQRWIKEGRYWFQYTLTSPPVILAVFYETADLPNRA